MFQYMVYTITFVKLWEGKCEIMGGDRSGWERVGGGKAVNGREEGWL